MSVETDTITAPTVWASALINGDASGMDDDEIANMNDWLAPLTDDGWRVVSADIDGTNRFTWDYAIYGGGYSGGEVCDYIIHRVTWSCRHGS